MVMGGKERHLRKSRQGVIQRGDCLKVEMVGGLIKNEDVGAGEHHPGEHAAHPLATREDRGLFQRLLSGKKHLAQEPTDKTLVLLRRCKLAQPADKIKLLIIEIRIVLFREICVGDGHAPSKTSFVRLKLPGQNLEQCGFYKAVSPDEGDLVALVDSEGEILEHGNPVDLFGKTIDLQNDVTTGPFRLEDDIGIFSGGDWHVLNGELLKQLLP